MARRNKKKRRDVFAFPVTFAGLVVIVVTLALAYVWLGCRCESVGKDLRGLEKERAVLGKILANEAYKWSLMKSPLNLKSTLTSRGIHMTWPRDGQIVRVRRSDLLNESGFPGAVEMAQIGRIARHE